MKVQLELIHINEDLPGEHDEVLVFTESLDKFYKVTLIAWNEGFGEGEAMTKWKLSDDVSWPLEDTPYWCCSVEKNGILDEQEGRRTGGADKPSPVEGATFNLMGVYHSAPLDYDIRNILHIIYNT